MERASYKLRGIEVETTGTLVKTGASSGGGKLVLKVDATGELLPVRLGGLPHTLGRVRVRAEVADWDTKEPVLEVTEIEPVAAATPSS